MVKCMYGGNFRPKRQTLHQTKRRKKKERLPSSPAKPPSLRKASSPSPVSRQLVTSLITHIVNHCMSIEIYTSRLIFSEVKISV